MHQFHGFYNRSHTPLIMRANTSWSDKPVVECTPMPFDLMHRKFEGVFLASLARLILLILATHRAIVLYFRYTVFGHGTLPCYVSSSRI